MSSPVSGEEPGTSGYRGRLLGSAKLLKSSPDEVLEISIHS